MKRCAKVLKKQLLSRRLYSQEIRAQLKVAVNTLVFCPALGLARAVCGNREVRRAPAAGRSTRGGRAAPRRKKCTAPFSRIGGAGASAGAGLERFFRGGEGEPESPASAPVAAAPLCFLPALGGGAALSVVLPRRVVAMFNGWADTQRPVCGWNWEMDQAVGDGLYANWRSL